MPEYYRVMLGKGGVFSQHGLEGNCIGVDFDIPQDLTGQLPDQWREFNRKFIPIWFEKNPDKSRVAAGLACGMLWTVSKGINIGDMVLSPDGTGSYLIGEVIGDYQYRPDSPLPHQRPVSWWDRKLARTGMSEALQKSSGSIGTVCKLTDYHDELERLIGTHTVPPIIATDETIEDPLTFAMEKHLEDFLVQNWPRTALGKEYEIYEEDGDCIGRQYQTDTGAIDILAASKDKKTLLVVELKRGRGNDVVVGQTLRYMGYVKDELAEPDQEVRGVIIAMQDDQRMRRALSVVTSVDFYRYEVTFKLYKE